MAQGPAIAVAPPWAGNTSGKDLGSARCPSTVPLDIVNFDDLAIDTLLRARRLSASQGHAEKSTSDIGRTTTTTRKPQRTDCFIYRLPNELLCAIFMMCGEVDDAFLYPRHDVHDALPPPMHLYSRATVLLGHVCLRWFAVTRGSRQLWTMVDVPFPQPCDVAALELSLRYSKGLPLTLRINGHYQLPKHLHTPETYQKFMCLVAAASHRWEEISFVVTQGPFRPFDGLHHLTSLPPQSFPSIKRAMLYFFGDDHRPTLPLWENFFRSTALRSLHWYGVGFRASSSSLERLTHVAVDHIDPMDVMECLRSCGQLRFLRAKVKSLESQLMGEDDGALIAKLPSPVDLPHLQVLMLAGMFDWTNLFDGITTPRLHRLDLINAGVQARAIEAMLQRSKSRLFMLGFGCVYCGQTQETEKILRSPTLRHLRIFLYETHPRYTVGEPETFDPRPFLPTYLSLYTREFAQADEAYWNGVATRDTPM
ncbi:uncharacterized protein SCHCODRAFT_01217310, partial [Schizophyllum commune H4-8]